MNKSLGLACAVLVAFAACAPRTAAAAIEDRAGRFGGQQVQYKVLLPPGYDKAKAYPMVLVFTGGPQTFAMTGRTIEADWQAEAQKRGYIVVSPGAPDAGLFFDRSPTPSVMPPAAEARRHVGPGLLCGACGTRNPPGADFCRACGTPLAVDSSLETRKTVTVLFCDVVGSTELGERLANSREWPNWSSDSEFRATRDQGAGDRADGAGGERG